MAGRILISLASLCLGASAAWAGAHAEPQQARFSTEDVDHFWQAWDKSEQAMTTDQRALIFFETYYLAGTPGLRDFIESRIGSVFQLLDTIDRHPRYYSSLRAHTDAIRGCEEPTRAAFRRMEELYPEAVFPDVYFLIGRLTSAGTTSERALLIGAEMYGMYPDTPTGELDDWLKSVLKPMDELPHIIAHELVHFQQHYPDDPSLLAGAISEGSADFIAELISGAHINENVHAWAASREAELWQAFRERMDAPGYDGWLFGGPRPEGWPQDVGYWVGYRICSAYYARAEDKGQAIREILNIDDFHAFLAASGYNGPQAPAPAPQ